MSRKIKAQDWVLAGGLILFAVAGLLLP